MHNKAIQMMTAQAPNTCTREEVGGAVVFKECTITNIAQSPRRRKKGPTLVIALAL